MSRISSNRTVTGGRVSAAHSPPWPGRLEPGSVSPFVEEPP